MTDAIEINGVVLSDTILSILSNWQDSGSQMDKTTPERYIDYLNDAQDYLIHSMLENGNPNNRVGELLEKLILIKDDLKLLVIRKQQDYEQN
ncbi:MAG: hypothetical protein E6772_07225 [Dysgonomonas sp.]|nr:hypothetical protein [Dysgonomonas sp.]